MFSKMIAGPGSAHILRGSYYSVGFNLNSQGGGSSCKPAQTLGLEISRLRKSHRWTIKHVSKKTNIPAGLVRYFEANEALPTQEQQQRLEAALKVKLGHFDRYCNPVAAAFIASVTGKNIEYVQFIDGGKLYVRTNEGSFEVSINSRQLSEKSK